MKSYETRQNDLASALCEIGRVDQLDWVSDVDMQRRAQVGLNKGESHHALKKALRIGRQGAFGTELYPFCIS